MPTNSLPTVSHAATNGDRAHSSSSGDLFNGFFSSGRKWDFQNNGIIDGRGHGVFGMMAAACEADVYPYQLPLESRTGPWVRAEGRRMLMLSSYDYLGLVGDQRIEKAAIEAVLKYGSATGGARMLTGTNDLHRKRNGISLRSKAPRPRCYGLVVPSQFGRCVPPRWRPASAFPA